MAERRFFRLLRVAVMTIVFTLLLVLPALADNTVGGKGAITGLDPSLSYEAKTVTINSAGNGCSYGDAFLLNSETNKNLAGLYVVSSDGFQTQSDIIYVEGAYSARADLGTYNSSTSKLNTALRTNATDSFQTGVYLGTRYGYSAATRFCNNYTFNETNVKTVFGADIVPTQKALADAIASNNTAEATKIKTAVKTILENYFISYAYTPDDIIPTSELLTMKFARAKLSAYDGFKISSVTAKVVFFVMDEKGTVTQHVWTDGGKTLNFYDSNLVENTVDVQSVLPDKGWVVGFKYYPAGEVSLDNITYYSTTSTSARIYEFTMQIGSSYDGYYVIKVPKAEKPEGITYDGETNTLHGLVAGMNYSLVPYTVLGASKTGEVKVSASAPDYTLTSPLGAGLWGIRVAASASHSESDPIIFYVEGSYKDRATLGVFEAGATMPNASRDRASASDEWKIGYYYGVNNNGTDAGITGKTFITDYVFSTAINNSRNTYGTYSEWPTATALKNAIDSNNTAKANEIRASVKSILESYSVNYAYTSDEIIPADELLTMKVARSKRSSYDNFTVRPVSAKVVFFVMDETGAIKEYTWNGLSKDLTPYSSALVEDTIDVQSVITDKDGWIVGFKYYPVGSVSADAIGVLSTGRGTGTEGKRVYDFNIRVGYNPNISDMAGYYVIKVPKAETPEGITYNGEDGTLSGLTAGTKYSLVPYTVVGAIEDKEVTITPTGATYTFTDNLDAGLWGIRIAASDSYSESDPIIFYVEGSYRDRQNIGSLTGEKLNATRDRAGADEIWKLGYFYGAAYDASLDFNNNYGFNAERIVNVYGAEFAPTPKALYDAVESEDTDAVVKIKAQVKTALENYFISYAYTSEEIIPASELLTMKFAKLKLGAYDGFAITPVSSRVVFAVMDKAGKITEYSWTGASQGVDYTSSTWAYDTVDVQSVLPDTGWVVGFRYYPMGEILTENIDAGKISQESARLYEFKVKLGSIYEGYYEIDVPKAEKPEGIVYDDETKTLSGLKPDTNYAMAQYTVIGRSEDSEILFTSTGESYTLPSGIGTGVWGLSFAADDKFATSDPALFYVKGKSDDRKNLGTYQDGSEAPLATRDRQSSEDTWKLGYFYGAGIAEGKLSNNYAFKADNVISIFGADMSPTPKALFDAVNAGDTEEADKIRQNVKTILENYFVSYAYTSDEIIPVSELFTIKIGLVKISAFDGFMVTNSKPRLDVYVMDADGRITPYSYKGGTRAVNYYSNTWVYDTINVQNDIDLPEEGWIVGFKYYPMQDIDQSHITTYSNNPTTAARVYELYFAMGTQYSDFYEIKEDGATPEISTFPVIPGGYGEIGGLSAQYQYEVQTYDSESGEWSQWQDVPAGSTAIRVTKSGDYRVRVKDTPRHGKSDIVEVTVYDYDAQFESFNSEIVKMHLPSDYTELEADYTMDVSVKNWVSYLTLENIKHLSPESVITFDGGDYKIVVTAKNVQIPADGKSHYYNMAVSFDGESRHDALYDMFREKAGDRYLTEVYFESSKALPFKSAQFMIYVGDEHSGLDLELRSYFEIIDRLRKVETATVFEGWVTFNNFSETYVVLLPK